MIKLICPDYIDKAKIIAYAIIDDQKIHTKKTKHIVSGKILGPAYGVTIAKYENGNDYYLFYCDKNWNALTDTCHETLEKAIEQLDFEYKKLSGKLIYKEKEKS